MRYIVLSAILIAGCNTMTPADLKSIGTSHVGQTAAPPDGAAHCIEHNATRDTQLYRATIEPKGDLTEVIGAHAEHRLGRSRRCGTL
jgi:predicted small secreted protein